MSRFDYVKYDKRSIEIQEPCKDLCRSLEALISCLGTGRATSIALTKLEECYMWIGKAIRDDQIARNCSSELQEERKDG